MEGKGEKNELGHHPPPPSEFPWLVFSHGERNRKQTFYSITDNSCTVCSIPELREKEIENSCHGWLILSSCSPSWKTLFSLWNPVTLETIQLPPLKLDTESEINGCILTSPPSHPDSTLMIFDKGVFSIWFCHLGRRCWFKHCYMEEMARYVDARTRNCVNNRGNSYLSNPVSCKGKVYANFQKIKGKVYARTYLSERFVRIDMIEPNSIVLQNLIKMPERRKQTPIFFRRYLVESNGDIFWIITSEEPRDYNYQVTDVEIHKLDLLSMAWERVFRAKDRAFFLSHGSESSTSICSEALGNHVYFIRQSDNGVYSYHLEDCNISTISLPCPDLWKLQKLWVMPDYRLIGIRGEAMQNSVKKNPDGEEHLLEEITTANPKKDREESKDGKEGSEASGMKLINLPIDILEYFCNHLTKLDYMSIRSVCRILGRVAAPALELSSAISRWETRINSLSPWLMFAQDNGRICRVAHPNSSNRYSVSVPEPLQDASIWYCKDGWILIGKERGDDIFCLSFYNPFTKDVITYPELHVQHLGYLRIGFSSPPTSSSCVVIVLEKVSRLNVCHSREKVWHIVDLDYDGEFWTLHNSPVFSNGAFYFLNEYGSLGVVKQQGQGWVWEILVQHETLDPYYDESFLAEHVGDVFIVLTYDIGERVRVLKLDPTTMSWKRVKNLGKYSLHVSRSSALFTVAETSEEKNKIYFPRFHGKHLVFYSLSTNSLQSSRSDESLKNYEGTTQPMVCCWIKPSWS